MVEQLQTCSPLPFSLACRTTGYVSQTGERPATTFQGQEAWNVPPMLVPGMGRQGVAWHPYVPGRVALDPVREDCTGEKAYQETRG